MKKKSELNKMVKSFMSGAQDQAEFKATYVVAALVGVLNSDGNVVKGINETALSLGKMILAGGAQRVVIDKLFNKDDTED